MIYQEDQIDFDLRLIDLFLVLMIVRPHNLKYDGRTSNNRLHKQ